ncbi:MAG TPA: response regulator [Spirochaetia bacterium]|nr:response regulator [Spirochaetia bacterium]
MVTPSILVVDDHPGVRLLLYEAFLDDGFDVELASSGAEALRKLQQLRPDVILLDLRMPGLSGLDTLRQLQAKSEGDFNVVIMTAYGETDLMREAKKMGVEWYITKPFDLVELRCMVKAVIAASSHPRLVQNLPMVL